MSDPLRVLLTGAGGFVGRALAPYLAERGHDVWPALRRGHPLVPGAPIVVREVAADTDWAPALRGVDAVVHLAARVHVTRDAAPDPLAAFRAVNRDGTRRLAEQAAAAGVRRFVFLSSIKVLGESAPRDAPFTDASPPAPADAYARSKHEAERALDEIAAGTGLQVVVLRPPLVYGPGATGNLGALLRLCDSPWPLPLGGLDNRRSLLARDSLCAAVAATLETPELAGGFVLADAAPVSTAEIVGALRAGLGRPRRLLPVPPALIRLAGALTGRGAAVRRLCGDLVVAPDGFARATGWRPAPSTCDGLVRMARATRETPDG